MGVVLGLEAKAYYKHASGDPTTPVAVADTGTWAELANIKDVSLNLTTGEADVTTRAAAGWRAKKGTLKEGTVDWQMVWDTEDDGFAAVSAAYFGNLTIGMRFLDDTIANSGVGLTADMSITNFSRSENLEEALMNDVTATVTYSATAPEWGAAS